MIRSYMTKCIKNYNRHVSGKISGALFTRPRSGTDKSHLKYVRTEVHAQPHENTGHSRCHVHELLCIPKLTLMCMVHIKKTACSQILFAHLPPTAIRYRIHIYRIPSHNILLW